MNPKFPWKRFWCTPEGVQQLDEHGYLRDPEGEYGKYFNPNVVGFEDIRRMSCLVLLGEPGIGKTHALEDEIRETKIHATENDIVQVLDLKEYGSEERLFRDLFESEEWKRLKVGNCRLYLFLDSLDEVRIRVPNVVGILQRGLKDAPIDRLFFRITCRTAEWPWSLKDKLVEIWPQDQVGIFELAPLRVHDVETAATLMGLDASAFVHAVNLKKAGSLASKPVMLQFLLNLYKKEDSFPEAQTDLYEKGCLYLCEEPSMERREKGAIDPRYVGQFSSEQRLVVASRVAACLILSNSFAIHTDIETDRLSEGIIALSRLIGGHEKTLSGSIDVGEGIIRETFRTGLFSSRGRHLMGFAHQTYVEFLAARYLSRMHLVQIQSLLLHPQGRLVPALYETASWLASQRPDVFSWLIALEPEILLRSDVTRASDDIKEKLISALMERFINEELLDFSGLVRYFDKLTHPRIGKQLRALIGNKNLGVIPRRLSFEIAEACKVKDLQELFSEIALDTQENYDIRSLAAHLVLIVADKEVRKRMEPLAKGLSGDDPDDTLRAHGMRCMWPDHWGLIDLIDHIVQPKKPNQIGGSYFWFLRHEVPTIISEISFVDELPLSISLLLDKPRKVNSHENIWYEDLHGAILKQAWKLIPDRNIMGKLSKLIALKLRQGQPICGERDGKVWAELSASLDRRRAIIKFIITESEINVEPFRLLSSSTPLVLDEDFPWLLEQIENAPFERQKAWGELIHYSLHEPFTVDRIGMFLVVRSRVPILQQMEPVYVEFDSELARNCKASYLKRRRWENQTKKEPSPPIIERISDALKRFEAGDINEWYDLTLLLSVDEQSGDLRAWPDSIVRTPGWTICDKGRQKRIGEAAISFLLAAEPPNEKWFSTGSYSWTVLSVALALEHLSINDITLSNLPVEALVKWIPHMLDLPFNSTAELRCVLFGTAYKASPEKTTKYLVRLIDGEEKKSGRIHFIDSLQSCWPQELDYVILSRIKAGGLNAGGFADLVHLLLKRNFDAVEPIMADYIKPPLSRNSQYDDYIVQCAVLAWENFGDKYWELIWNILNERYDLADKILLSIRSLNGRHAGKLLYEHAEANLVDLYAYMSRRFPPEEDPRIEEVHEVGPRELLGDFRKAVLRFLASKSSAAACDAIECLIQKFPNQRDYLLWTLREVKVNALSKTWMPPEASDIISLTQDDLRRYIECEEQLLAVIVESLSRMQNDYKGELASVERLWNYDGAGTARKNFRPKDEESLSDEVARWLKADLSSNTAVVVNREVQIQRGQKTDIRVDAIKDNGQGIQVLTAIIEVKGCWNQNLMTDMDNQLVETYMKTNACSCGLYLVGWFASDKWKDGDWRKKSDGCKAQLEVLCQALLEQSNVLHKKYDFISALRSFVLNLAL